MLQIHVNALHCARRPGKTGSLSTVTWIALSRNGPVTEMERMRVAGGGEEKTAQASRHASGGLCIALVIF